MTKCNRCEKLPDTSNQNGTLYISPPMTPTEITIKQILNRNLIKHEWINDDVLGIKINYDTRKKLCSDFNNSLTELELRDTKCFFLPEGELFGPGNLMDVKTLGQFIHVSDSNWFFDLLSDERLETWFHPIVQCEKPDEIFAYECLSRGKNPDGSIVFPNDLFGTARSTDMLFYLDRLCRQTAVKNGAKHGINHKLFINFIPTVIYDPEHCLKSTLAAIEKTSFQPENIVFEVIETDQVNDINHLLNIINYYRENGFSIALDDLGAGYGSLNLLHQIRPDFIKIDMELIRDVDKDTYKSMIVDNIINLANDLKIKSIAEGVESTGEWQWLKNHGLTYIQGYLFAKPSPIPPIPKIL